MKLFELAGLQPPATPMGQASQSGSTTLGAPAPNVWQSPAIGSQPQQMSAADKQKRRTDIQAQINSLQQQIMTLKKELAGIK